MRSTMADKKQLVARPSQMSDEHMRLHMNYRHGMDIGDHNFTFDVAQPYRALHRRQHHLLPGLTHEHSPDTPQDEMELVLTCMLQNRLHGWRQIAGAKGVVCFNDDGSFGIRIDGKVQHYNRIEQVAKILLKGKFR